MAKPVPKRNQVLIRTYATTVAIEDVQMRRSTGPNALGKTTATVLGTIVAGEVEAVGRDIKRFKEGDQVYGFTGFFGGLGAYAEYTCLPENGVMAPKPPNVTYQEAAAVPYGGANALYFLRKGEIQSAQQVLICGASGAIGSSAVQLAKSFGAEVVRVCSTTNLELVRSLGADRVVD